VAYYHISVNKLRKDARPEDVIRIPKGTNAREITGLPEGDNRIYMWSEDTVGNMGGEVFTTVRIDTEPVYFGDFYPVSGEWITNQRPSCSIWINDTNTGVDPLRIEYQISTTGEVDLGDQWDLLQESYSPDNSLYIVVTGWFKNGKENWMRFRAWDVAGNGPKVSPAYNVWIDAVPPTYVMRSPLESDYQLSSNQEVKIEIRDPDSGVDFSSIEYRVSTQGRSKFGPWLPYKDATGNPNQVEVRIREEFLRGDQNYVQVRARDLAGNQMSTSAMFNVKINTFPVIVRTSPTPNEIYYEGDVIVFDATATYDPDGEIPQITWYRNDPSGLVTFATSSRLATDDFAAGDYAITVEAKSGALPPITEVFTLRVHPKPTVIIEIDSDGDGMFDWWEDMFSTDKAVKDADKDYDADGFTNFQEFENGTEPLNPLSKPPTPPVPQDRSTLGLFEGDMYMLLVGLAIITLAVLITMMVAKRKKDQAEKRIRTVRNMRRIMPSVSWEHITAASYLAAASSQNMLAQVSGPALPGPAPLGDDQALPPAPENVVQ
jgi:hypothetical protein